MDLVDYIECREIPGDDAVVVTGCLTSARQLRAAGTAAETLTRLVARAVRGAEEG